MSVSQQLVPALKQLRLSGVLETLEVRNQQALGERAELNRAPLAHASWDY
jgi:hypothetical protein